MILVVVFFLLACMAFSPICQEYGEDKNICKGGK